MVPVAPLPWRKVGGHDGPAPNPDIEQVKQVGRCPFSLMLRPGLTLALWVSSMIMAVWYRTTNPELMTFIITSTFGMFSISVGYWFGVRTEQKMAIRAVK